MVNYWLCVTNEENWEVVKKRKLWGVSERNRAQIEKVELGDNLVFYVKPQRLMGIFQAVSKSFKADEGIFSTSGFASGEIFPYRVELKSYVMPKEPVLFKIIVPKLKFITNKEKWMGHLRRAMQIIPKEDYYIMKTSLERS